MLDFLDFDFYKKVVLYTFACVAKLLPVYYVIFTLLSTS